MTCVDRYDAIIIGAGPAGMMAAITASGRGRKVLLLEKMSEPGRKLLISGKGRCNLTNAGTIDKFLKKFSKSGVFLRNVFAAFFNDDLCAFFESAGCALKTERGERVFPDSDRSLDVLSALMARLKACGTHIKLSAEVNNIILAPDSKKVIIKSGEKFAAPKVIIATGGFSYPGTGSTGFGFKLAAKLGHTVIAPRPGLVPLVAKSDLPRILTGLSLENVKCSVISENKIIDDRLGDMLFTHFGFSGPIILDLSATIYDLLQEKKSLATKRDSRSLGTNFDPQNSKVFISINLKPGLDAKKLDGRLQRDFLANPSKTIKNVFAGLLPQRLIEPFLRYCRIDESKKSNQVTREDRKRIVECLFDFRFEITGTRPLEDAIITRGGVMTKEIDPKTMESKIVKGLYFAGEVIDVDAKTGGYNMQAAFSTGFACGKNL